MGDKNNSSSKKQKNASPAKAEANGPEPVQQTPVKKDANSEERKTNSGPPPSRIIANLFRSIAIQESEVS